MSFWAIVPAKDPGDAKSRLASVLSRAERRELALMLLRRTLDVLAQVPGCEQRVVVSASVEVLDIATAAQCLALQEATDGSIQPLPAVFSADSGQQPDLLLNAAVAQGAQYAADHGATAVLIVPADLPFLDPSALREIEQLAPPAPGIVIAPDRSRKGTNVLFVRPPVALPFSYGVDSFSVHRRTAVAKGLACTVVESPALALDLDTPLDLEQVSTEGTEHHLDSVLARLVTAAHAAHGRPQ